MKLYVKKRISFTKLVETNLHCTPAKKYENIILSKSLSSPNFMLLEIFEKL